MPPRPIPAASSVHPPHLPLEDLRAVPSGWELCVVPRSRGACRDRLSECLRARATVESHAGHEHRAISALALLSDGALASVATVDRGEPRDALSIEAAERVWTVAGGSAFASYGGADEGRTVIAGRATRNTGADIAGWAVG